jgi:hypothetical protein
MTARELLSFSWPCLMLMNKLSLRGECGEDASTYLAQTWTLHPDGGRASRRRPWQFGRGWAEKNIEHDDADTYTETYESGFLYAFEE